MIDLDLLKNELRQDAYAALSDAEAAAAVPSITKTPRMAPVTLKTLAATWGPGAAGNFLDSLKSASGTDKVASLFFALLQSGGFDATDPAMPTAFASVVSGKIVTQELVDAALYDISFPFGAAPTEADVAEARRLIGAEETAFVAYRKNLERWNVYSAAFEAYRLGGFAGDPPGDL